MHSRESLDDCEQNVHRNMDLEHHSYEVSEKMRNRLLEISGKVILVLTWQGAWLNCDQVLCGKWNLQAIKLDV